MDRKKIVLMSGLPRSGSTLLSALLNQNPRIHTEPSSPLLNVMESMEGLIKKSEPYKAYPKPDALTRTIQDLFQSYYFSSEKPVVVDKNRGWSEKIEEIEKYLMPQAKIIYPVRDLTEVLSSLLKIAHANPFNTKTGRHNFIDNSLVMLGRPVTDEHRCRMMLSDTGIIGQCMVSITKALKNGHKDKFLFVEYRDLVSSPQDQLDRIYDFIDEERWEHDFDNIVRPNQERDEEVFSAPELHRVHKMLLPSRTDPKLILPEGLYNSLQGKEIWRS